MVLEPIKCPNCDGVNVGKHGRTTNGKQRFICKERDCEEKTFIRDYSDKGRLPEIKQKIIEMAVNGSGVRDTARVLSISIATVINELKKTRIANSARNAGLTANSGDAPTKNQILGGHFRLGLPLFKLSLRS